MEIEKIIDISFVCQANDEIEAVCLLEILSVHVERTETLQAFEIHFAPRKIKKNVTTLHY